MSKSFIFLLMFVLLLPAVNSVSNAASAPLLSVSAVAPTNMAAVTALEKPGKQKGLFAKWKQKLLAKAMQKGWLGEGEMTEKQKRQAKWSMILGLGSIVLLLVPYVSLIAIPAAIVALVLGIKSVEGNSNSQGIIGIIAGGLTLVLLLVAIAVMAAFFASWN